MVKIHWSVYLILGIGVLVASYKIDSQSFRLFIWVGYLFLVIGVAKLVFWFITNKKESSLDKKELRREIQQNAPKGHGLSRYCMRCGVPLKGNENFCSSCGQRLSMRIGL